MTPAEVPSRRRDARLQRAARGRSRLGDEGAEGTVLSSEGSRRTESVDAFVHSFETLIHSSIHPSID